MAKGVSAARVDDLIINPRLSGKGYSVTVWLEDGEAWRASWGGRDEPSEAEVVSAFEVDRTTGDITKNWDRV